MHDEPLDKVIQHVLGLVRAQHAEDLSDPTLLQRFITSRDEMAFTALVQRHGPHIQGLCDRLLGNAHDAEDAFQATFLVLARKAGSLRKHESLGSWLHAVAFRTAMHVKAHRQTTRADLDTIPAPSAPCPVERQEAHAVLDEELSRLPTKYRSALLMQLQEGPNVEEAARRLGWTPGTYRGIVHRARQLLQKRFQRRGAVLTVGLLASVPPGRAVSATLIQATVRGALGFVGSQLPLESASSAAVLAKTMLSSMSTKKLKAVVAVALAAGLLGVGTVALSQWVTREPSPAPIPEAVLAGPPDDPKAALPVRARDEHGDPLPVGAFRRLGTVRMRHADYVNGVAFSPDGKLLASCSKDGTVRLWDPATGKAIALLDAGQEAVTSVAFASDGKTLAAGSVDHTVRLWETASGRLLSQLRGHSDGVWSVAFAPDGQTLASAGGPNDPTIRLWSVATGKEIRRLTGHRGRVFTVAFSPDGTTLASGGQDQVVRLWDAAGRPIRQLQGHAGAVFSVAFSPDGKTLASGGADQTLRLWDVVGGKQVRQRVAGSVRGPVWCVAFSRDGRTLATGCLDHSIRLWEAATGKEIRELKGHLSIVQCVAFAPDGRTLASGSGNWNISGEGDNTVRLWDVTSGEEIRRPTGHQCALTTVGFAPDGKVVASASLDATIRLWDAARGKEIRVLADRTLPTPAQTRPKVCPVWGMTFSPDGKVLAACRADNTVRLWDVAAGKELRRLVGHQAMAWTASFSPDGKVLATGSQDKTVRMWDVAAGREIRCLWGHREWVTHVSFSADGRTVASACEAGTVRLWEAATGRELRMLTLPGRKGEVMAVAVSSDSKVLACADGATVQLWETATGNLIRKLVGHGSPVLLLDFSPDGKTLAAGTATTIHLWEVATGQRRLTLAELGNRLTSFSFSPDGRTLVSGQANMTVLFWDIDSGRR